MPCRIAHQLVIPALPSLLHLHPMLKIHVSSSDHQTDIVQAGFDCLLRVGTLENSRLIAKTIGKLKMINCVSPSYVQRYGLPNTLEQLSQHYMVNYSSTATPQATFDYQHLQDQSMLRLSLPYQISVNNTEAYISAALAGFGLIQVPRFDVQALLDSGQLIAVLAEATSPPLPINLIYPSREYMPRRLNLMMQWLKDLIQPHCIQA